MDKTGYLSHFKKNFSLAYPVMLSQLGQVFVGVADNVMVGRVGVVPLAAASLAGVLFFVMLTFGMGVSYAITPLVAAADGADDKSRSAEVLKNGLLINIILGIGLFLVVYSGSNVLHFWNQPDDVVALAIPYLEIITFSMIPFMVFQTFRQFAEGLSLTKQAMFFTIGANVVNVVLNYILIFGKFGFEPMGLNGAGWATFIARVLMAVGMGAFIYFAPRFATYRERFKKAVISSPMIKRMLNLGLPAAFQFTFEVGAFGFAAIMAGWLGAKALAAHQIAINLSSITYMLATGVSAAATIRVGNQLGRKDIPTMRMAGFTSFGTVILMMSIAAIVFVLGRDFLPSLYVDNLDVIEMASGLVVIAAFFQISDGVQVVGLGALRGMEDVKIPTVITFVAYWVLGLPIGYLLSFKMGYGVNGVWYGLLIGLSVTALLLYIRFNYISKKMVLTNPKVINQG